jgi:hypothetical protein
MEQATTADLAAGEAGMQALGSEGVGRIVEATIQDLVAECLPQCQAPPLGALLVTVDGEHPVYAAVTGITTAGIDPSRPVIPHGGADEDLDTVLSRNPHLPMLLRTSFSALILAHHGSGGIRHYLPDAPPPLFARIRACDIEEQALFVGGLEFVEPLLGAGDDAAAAFIRRASRSGPNAAGFLLETGRRLVPLLSGDPERLTSLLRRIRP